MIKNPEDHLRASELERTRRLARMSVRERISIGEDLIRALFRHHPPRMRRDRPKALAFYVGSGNRT
jgi:hypothetical protein